MAQKEDPFLCYKSLKTMHEKTLNLRIQTLESPHKSTARVNNSLQIKALKNNGKQE